MALGKSVQFNTAEHVIDAYVMRGVPMYAVFQGSQLLTKYEGTDIDEGAELLAQFLTMLAQSAAIYTLAVYEEIDKGARISVKTPYHGSFNFRFQEVTNFQQVSGMSAVQQQLQKLSAEIEQLRRDRLHDEIEDPLESQQDPSALDKINGFLSHPLVERFLPVLLGALQPRAGIPGQVAQDPGQVAQDSGQVPRMQPVYGQYQQPFDNNQELAKVSGVGGIVVGDYEISDPLLHAVGAMVTAFPETETALIQLAEIAANKPDKFKTILGYLKYL